MPIRNVSQESSSSEIVEIQKQIRLTDRKRRFRISRCELDDSDTGEDLTIPPSKRLVGLRDLA